MKRIVTIIFALTLMLYFTGFVEKIELNQLGIVAGMGIDKTEDGYLVTTQLYNPEAIAGKNSNALPIVSLTAEGDTFYEAFHKIDSLTTKVLYFAHLDVLVVDETIAKEGINSVLDFSLRHTEIRPDVNIIIAKDARANEVLNVLTALNPVPATQLDVFSNMIEKYTGHLTSYNLYDVVNSMNTPGVSAVLNTVSIISETLGEKKMATPEDLEMAGTADNLSNITTPVKLEIRDLAVFKLDKLAGYMSETDSQFYNLLKGKEKHYLLKVKIDDEFFLTLETEQIKTKITPHLKENKVMIECEVKGVLVERGYPMDLSVENNIKLAQYYLEEQLRADLFKFLKKSQQELKADVLGIGEKAFYKDYEDWTAIQGYWDEIYPELDFDLNIKVHIKTVGEILNIR